MLEIVIIIIVIILLVVWLLRTSYPKLKAGYHHRVILDSDSIDAINNLLIDIEKTVDYGYLVSKINKMANDVRRKDNFFAWDYANDQMVYDNAKDLLSKHPEISEEDLKRLSWEQFCEDRDFAFNFAESIIDGTEYKTDNPIHKKVVSNPLFKDFSIHGNIDLSDFSPIQYVPTDPNDEYKPLSRLFEDKLFDDTGFQMKHDADNIIRVSPLTDDEIFDITLAANRNSRRRIRIHKTSVVIEYADKAKGNCVTTYKGVDAEFLHDVIDNKLVPFKLLTEGYELLNDSRGYGSGYGLYTTPNFNIAKSYSDGIIYRYKIYYERYTYSFIDEYVSDETLRWLTENFSPANVRYPSYNSLMYWYVRHPEITDLQRYFQDDGREIERFRDILHRECPGFTDTPVKFDTSKYKSMEDRKAREAFYDKLNVDMIVSYTHASNTSTYSQHDGSIYESLERYIPCFEIVSRPGSRVRVDAIILFDEAN